MARLTKHKSIFNGEAEFRMIGKGFNMMDVTVRHMIAAGAPLQQVFATGFAHIAFYPENKLSPSLVFGLFADNNMVHSAATLPRRALLPALSTSLGFRKVFSVLWAELAALQKFSPVSGLNAVFLHKAKDEGRTTAEKFRNLFLCFAIGNVFTAQIVFGDTKLFAQGVDRPHRTHLYSCLLQPTPDNFGGAAVKFSDGLATLEFDRVHTDNGVNINSVFSFHVTNNNTVEPTSQHFRIANRVNCWDTPPSVTRAISSQASYVSASPGMRKVQRLGGDERITRPRAPGYRKVDDIVWPAWEHAEVRDKQPCDNNATIENISPVDSLFYSKIGAAKKATQTKVEWQIDTLAAASDNAAAEGDTTAAEAITPTARVYNMCQIQKKVFQVSGTMEATEAAGRASEIDYQTAKKMKELSKDIEYAFLRGTLSTSDPRKMKGALNWCTTNLGKADDATLNANGTVTGGTARPLTEDLIKAQLQNTFTQGGSVDTIYGAPYQKQQISNFVNTGNTRRSVEGKTLTNAVDVYDSDFGLIAIKPHRNMPTDVILGVDHAYWKKATLRPLFREQLAKQGDSWPFHIVVEHTLRAGAEASSFRLTNLTSSDAA